MTVDAIKVAVIGSGPSGYSAAIYAARAMLQPVLFAGFQSGIAGGQLMTTTDVENYPGFSDGVSGPELMDRMQKQAEKFGTKVLLEDVISLDTSKRPFLIETQERTLYAHFIIIATGASAKRLDIKGTRDGELWQKGVSACAVCDGAMPLFRNKDLFVIGGGDSAMEEALFLTRYASRVFIVHRRDVFRASKIMADRVLHHPKITVLWDSVVEEVLGDSVVRSIRIKNVKTDTAEIHPAAGVFFAVGHEPNTAFLNGAVQLDELGYVRLIPGTNKTSVPGIFAAGDVHDRKFRQAITAAAAGCMASMEVEREWSAMEMGG